MTRRTIPSHQSGGCADCARAVKNPHTGHITFACLECRARSLAGSPAYFDSERAQTLLPTYSAALRCFFPDDALEAAHAKVKRWAARLTP